MNKRSIFRAIVFIIMFGHFVNLFLFSDSYSQCYNPGIQDYIQGGRIYIGDPWGSYTEPENFMMIENTSTTKFKNVKVKFRHYERHNAPPATGDTYQMWYNPPKLVQICPEDPPHPVSTMWFTLMGETPDPFPYPHLECSDSDLSQNIEPGQTLTIQYPDFSLSEKVYYPVTYKAVVSDYCCIEYGYIGPQYSCINGYWGTYEETVTKDYAVTECVWDDGVGVGGENIVTGGYLGCGEFNAAFEETWIDAGRWWPVWVKKPIIHVKITPSVQKTKPRELLSFTVEYENDSEDTYNNVVLVAYLPEHTAYVDNSATYMGFNPPVYNSDQKRLEWNLKSVTPGKKGTAVFEVQVDSCIPEGNVNVSGKAQIVISDIIHSESISTQVTLETLELKKISQEKIVNLNGTIYYTLTLKNLCDCDLQGAVTVTDPLPNFTTFWSIEEGGQFSSSGDQGLWENILFGALEEKKLHISCVVDYIPETKEINNQYLVTFSNGLEQISELSRTYVGDGLFIELKDYVKGDAKEGTYDTNFAVLTGFVKSSLPPEELAQFYSRLKVEVEITYSNKDFVDQLKSEGLLTEEDTRLPVIVVNTNDGSLQLEDGTKDIPLKLFDVVTSILIRVKDSSAFFEEQEVTAKCLFYERRVEALAVLDQLNVKGVSTYYQLQKDFIDGLYPIFIKIGVGDFEGSRRMTEAIQRILYAEKITVAAASVLFDILKEVKKIEGDFITAGDFLEFLFMWENNPIDSLWKSKIAPKLTKKFAGQFPGAAKFIEGKFKGLKNYLDTDLKDAIVKKLKSKRSDIIQKALTDPALNSIEHILDETLGEAVINQAKETLKSIVDNFGIKKMDEAAINNIFKSSQDKWQPDLFTNDKDSYLWVLSYLLMASLDRALNWQGDSEFAETNYQRSIGKLMGHNSDFTRYAGLSDYGAQLAGAFGSAGDWTNVVTLGTAKWAGNLETALGVFGRNLVRQHEGTSAKRYLYFLTMMTDACIKSVIDSSAFVDPIDPTADMPEAIHNILGQLQAALGGNDANQIITIFGQFSDEFPRFTAWVKEVQVKASYVVPRTGMRFEEHSLNYDRFLNALMVVNRDLSAVRNWALAHLLDMEDPSTKSAFLNAVIQAKGSQTELMLTAGPIVGLLNQSNIPGLVTLIKIEKPEQIETGVPFDLAVTAKNVGELPASGIKVKLIPSQGLNCLSGQELLFGDMNPGEAKSGTFQMRIDGFSLVPEMLILHLIGEDANQYILHDSSRINLPVQKAVAEGTIGSMGGTISTSNQELTLNVPAGAVSEDRKFILAPLTLYTDLKDNNVGGYFDVAALDALSEFIQSFNKPLEMVFKFKDEDLKGVDKTALQIWYFDESTSTWVPVPSLNIPNSNTVIGYTKHLSTFGLFPGTPNADSDTDGMPDWWEAKYGFNPGDRFDADGDLDGDHLSNVAEYRAGSDPLNSDSDGDGTEDGYIGTVEDLTAFRSSASSVSLSFTSPSHEATGGAASYDLRYAKGMITEGSWMSATEAWGEQAPLSPRLQESITVRGLEGNTTYCFGLKSVDSGGGVSVLSNVVCTRTSGENDWVRYSDAVISRGGVGAFDEGPVHHPAVIFDATDPAYPGGVYKMWYSGSSGSGTEERHRIGYATSLDGVSWTKHTGSGTGGSVIDLSEINGFIESMINTPAVIKDETEPDPNARYKLWYYQYGGWGEVDSNAVVYCTSPDGVNWTKRATVIRRCKYECVGGCKAGCEEGRFDWINAYFPSILKDESEPDPSARYKMWYTGYKEGGEYGIGYAISPDGINWTRVNGPNPDRSVLTKEMLSAENFDGTRVWTPSVVKIGDTYVMFYSGGGSRSLSPTGAGVGGDVRTVGYGTSKDGVNWERIPGTGTGGSSLDLGASGQFDEEGVLTPSVVWDGSLFRVWYGGTYRDGGRRIGYAASRSGMEYLFTIRYSEKQEIGAGGGVITITDTGSPVVGASVQVPVGVLETAVTLTIGEFSMELPPLPEGVSGMSLPVHFGPEGMDFSPHTVKIGIPYKDADLLAAGITDPGLLDVYLFDPVGEQWQKVVGPRTVDEASRVIWVEVSHFSIYRLGFTEVEKEAPEADAGGPYSGWTGVALTFNAGGSSDSDGTIVLYEWDWNNDGTYDESSSSSIIQYTWGSAYSGSVNLRVTDDDGLTGVNSASVEIQVSTRRVSGGAYFYPENTIYRASFSMDVKGPVSPTGWLKYYYTRTRMNFVSTGITSVGVSGATATITGTGTVNGVSGYTFTAVVTNGTPDSFALVIKRSDGSTYYSIGPKNISGGDLVIQ